MNPIDKNIDNDKLEQKMRGMNKEELLSEIMDGLLRCARKHSHSHEQEKDFIQDGMVSVLEVFDSYYYKPREEIIKIAGKAIYNKICGKQRKNITFDRTHVFKEIDEIYEINEVEIRDEMEIRNFIKVLYSKLSNLDKRVLKEKLDPSDETINAMLIDKDEKNKKRSTGKLVMNIDSEEITYSHLSKSLNISKATLSRSMSRIQEIVQKLLNC